MNEPEFLRVPYAQSVHGQAEIDAVVEVLKTSTQMGKNVTEMEQRVAEMFNKKFGLMTNSGTSSLMLAAEVAELPKESEVITAAFTFATTVTPILKNDLVPVFMDAEKDTLNIDASDQHSSYFFLYWTPVLPRAAFELPEHVSGMVE